MIGWQLCFWLLCCLLLSRWNQASSINVRLHWSKLSEQFFLLDPSKEEVEVSNRDDLFVTEKRFKSGRRKISGSEKQAVFVGTGLKLEPGKVHQLSVEVLSVAAEEDFLGTARGLRVGVGSVDGVTPGSSKHREWTVNSDGRWSVVGVADWQFDENNDVVWGAESRDGWHGVNAGERLVLTVNLQQPDPYIRFQRGPEGLLMTLDKFQKLSGFRERYPQAGFEQPQQLYVRGKPLGFEPARFGGDLPDRQPLQANLVASDPTDACTTLDNSGPTSIAGKIAYVQRGGCHFVDKVLNAQLAGAMAVIVGNTNDEQYDAEELIIMDAGDSQEQFDVRIPAVFVSVASANYIESQLEKYRKSVLASLLGPKFTPASNGWSLLEKGLYPLVWLSPGQSVKVSKCEQNEKQSTSPSLEEVVRAEICRPVTYLPLASSELSYMLRSEERASTAGYNERKDGGIFSKRLVRSVISCRKRKKEAVTEGGQHDSFENELSSRVGPILNTLENVLAWSPERMVEFQVGGGRQQDFSFLDDVSGRYKYAKFGHGWINALSTPERVYCENITALAEVGNITVLSFRTRSPGGVSGVHDPGICSYTRSLVELPKSVPRHLGKPASQLIVDFGVASLRERQLYYWEFQVEEPKHSSNYSRTPAVLQVGLATAGYGPNHPRHRTWLISSTRQWLSPHADGLVDWKEGPLGSFWRGVSGSTNNCSMGMLVDLGEGLVTFVLNSDGADSRRLLYLFNLSKFEQSPDVIPKTAWGWEGVENGTPRRFPSFNGQFITENGYQPVLNWVCGAGCEGGETVRIIEHSLPTATALSASILANCSAQFEGKASAENFMVDCTGKS